MPIPVISYISPTQADAGTSSVSLTIYGQNFDTNTLVNFGSTSLMTTFISGSQISTLVPSSSLTTGILGNVSVTTTNLYGTSNSAPFSIIPASTTQLSDLNSIALGINVSGLTVNANAISPYTKIINNVQYYTVQQNDSLQSIAQNVLGDATQWMDIAFINNLRYPYISTDPLDISGTNSSLTVTLTSNANVGDETVSLNNLNQNLEVGAILFFQLANKLTNGSLNAVSEIHPIVGLTTNSYNYVVVAELDSPLENNYLAGTTLNILNTANNTTSVVVQPGQAILIPSNIPNTSIINGNNSASSDPNIFLGSDFELDANGNLNVDSTGDIEGVSGIDNLRQALLDRLETEVGELVYHPNYGNPLIDYIGSVNGNSLAILANKKLSATLLQDPRVSQITNITTQVFTDTISTNVDLQISSNSSGTSLNFILDNG